MASFHSKLLLAVPGIRHAFDDSATGTPSGIVSCKQVHGCEIFEVTEANADIAAGTEADGIITGTARTIGIKTADCLPVLIASRSGDLVGALHAGWRGLHRGVLPRGVRMLTNRGALAPELIVAFGPAIEPCCFEVSPDVVDLFEKDWGHLWKDAAKPWSAAQTASRAGAARQARPTSKAAPWLDLKAIARLQLHALGIPLEQIEEVALCTYCAHGELASFRRATHAGNNRDPLTKARQWSWISARQD